MGVEDAAHDALVRAVASAFDGSSRREFRKRLGTIIDRTAADWFRKRERRPAGTQSGIALASRIGIDYVDAANVASEPAEGGSAESSANSSGDIKATAGECGRVQKGSTA
jgi:DNA-directed RNA polymerase specialized sigma24 family protein